MFWQDAPDSSWQVLEEKKKEFLDSLPPAHEDGSPEVRILYRRAIERVFEEGNTAEKIVKDCGIGDNNVYSRFRHEVGVGIRELIVALRIQCAKILLEECQEASIAEIAYAVGYGSSGGFGMTFKRHVGCSPSEFREQAEG